MATYHKATSFSSYVRFNNMFMYTVLFSFVSSFSFHLANRLPIEDAHMHPAHRSYAAPNHPVGEHSTKIEIFWLRLENVDWRFYALIADER